MANNTYLVAKSGNMDHYETLRRLGFIHVCGGPGADESQWWGEGVSPERNREARKIKQVKEIGATTRNPLE